MINFIVSGQVPGTHLQITFLLWQLTICGLLAYVAVRVFGKFKRASADGASEDEVAQQTTQTA
ncbi:MAG TPA: hypothetical protein VIM53_00805 [Candidatus Saccharimonadales bacterium]